MKIQVTYSEGGADPLLSNNEVNGVRLTWQELAHRRAEELVRLRCWHSLISDLDRCEHGRHHLDACAGCGGPSSGNAFLPVGTRIGTEMGGRSITVPEPDNQLSFNEWFSEWFEDFH